MSSFLVAYATSHGQTQAIAQALGARLRERGHHVDVVDASEPGGPGPAGYDAIILGSRIHGDAFARSIRRYVRKHRACLHNQMVAVFSVGMSAAARTSDPSSAIDRFCRASGLAPGRSATFAGALPYRKYGPVLRFLMKRIAAKNGLDVDTSRDHEYTDWAAVDQFADDLDLDVGRAGDEPDPDEDFVGHGEAAAVLGDDAGEREGDQPAAP